MKAQLTREHELINSISFHLGVLQGRANDLSYKLHELHELQLQRETTMRICPKCSALMWGENCVNESCDNHYLTLDRMFEKFEDEVIEASRLLKRIYAHARLFANEED